jgi:hypothetical protein
MGPSWGVPTQRSELIGHAVVEMDHALALFVRLTLEGHRTKPQCGGDGRFGALPKSASLAPAIRQLRPLGMCGEHRFEIGAVDHRTNSIVLDGRIASLAEAVEQRLPHHPSLPIIA